MLNQISMDYSRAVAKVWWERHLAWVQLWGGGGGQCWWLLPAIKVRLPCNPNTRRGSYSGNSTTSLHSLCVYVPPSLSMLLLPPASLCAFPFLTASAVPLKCSIIPGWASLSLSLPPMPLYAPLYIIVRLPFRPVSPSRTVPPMSF